MAYAKQGIDPRKMFRWEPHGYFGLVVSFDWIGDFTQLIPLVGANEAAKPRPKRSGWHRVIASMHEAAGKVFIV